MIQPSLPQIWQYILLLLHASLQKIDKRLPIKWWVVRFFNYIPVLVYYWVILYIKCNTSRKKKEYLKIILRVWKVFIEFCLSCCFWKLIFVYPKYMCADRYIYIYVNTYTNNGIPSQLFFLYKYLWNRKSFHAFGTPSKQWMLCLCWYTQIPAS